MGLPEVKLTIQDGALGAVPASAGNVQVKLGVCSKAAANSIHSIGSTKAANDNLGSGPMVDALIQALSVAGGPVIGQAVNPSVAGTVTGAFTLTGTGAGTVTGAKGPDRVIRIKIILGGTPGTMTFQYSVDGAAYSSTITSGANPYSFPVPKTLSTAVFGNVTYVADDVYTLNTDGTIARTGSGPATALDGSTHNPLDVYAIQVKIVTAGALATAAFKYSLDGGNTFSGQIATPAGGRYAIPGTGVVLIFASTFVLDDLYTGVTTAAGFANGDVTTALVALLADAREWGWVHVVGTPSSAANSASLASTVDTQMTAAQTGFRYVFGVVECPSSESDSTIAAAFAAISTTRIAVGVGDVALNSPATGRRDRRNIAWAATARLASIRLSKDPAEVKQGALKNVAGLYRDEAATPVLDAARFITARTYTGQTGYYLTNFKMMAPGGSDYTYVMNRRVMDRACQLARGGYLWYLNSDVRIDLTTGYIDERDAQAIDANVTQKMKAGLTGDVSSVSAVLSRTDNLLSTSVANATVRAVPKGYLKEIAVDIGFLNPALQAAA